MVSVQKSGDDPTTDDLKADLAALRKDLSALTNTVGKMASAQAEGATATVRENLRTLAARGEETAAQARVQAEQAYEDLHDAISRNPLAAILIAVGLGFLIGVLTRNRS